jgi:membrane protein implicated in regulation of membrane protease activity
VWDKIWDFLTSDDKAVRMLMRIALSAFVVLVYILASKMSVLLFAALAIIVLGAAFSVWMYGKASEREAKRETERLRKDEEDDDGVTGYIQVRPEELEGPPWENRPRPPVNGKDKEE